MPHQHSRKSSSRRRRSVDIDTTDQDEVSSWDSLSSSSSSSSSNSDDAGITSKLPTLPDLRFEQSYLATIRGFLHEDQPHHTSKDGSELDAKQDGEKDHHHKVSITHSKAKLKHEHELWFGNLRVEW